jgi:hypothetical protein
MSAPLNAVTDQDAANILHEITRALYGLRFGSVDITVRNSQIVQIERKEKIRLQAASNRQA